MQVARLPTRDEWEKARREVPGVQPAPPPARPADDAVPSSAAPWTDRISEFARTDHLGIAKHYWWAAAVIVLVLIAVAASIGGSGGSPSAAAVESSVSDAYQRYMSEQYVPNDQFDDLRCSGSGSTFDCVIRDTVLGSTSVSIDYTVKVDKEGCWTAHNTEGLAETGTNTFDGWSQVHRPCM